MPLQTQLITLPFVKGVETKLDPKLVDNGSLLALENASFDKTGSLSRRDAIAELPGSALPEAPRGVLAYSNELLTISGEALYSYSPESGRQIERGTVSACGVSKRSVVQATSFASMPDMATAQGLTCYVWRTSTATASHTVTGTGVMVTVVDEKTGAVILSATRISSSSTAANPRVVAVTSGGPSDECAFIVSWGNGSLVQAAAVRVQDMSVSAVVTVATDNYGAVNPPLLAAVSVGGSAVIAYRVDPGTSSTAALLVGFVRGAVTVLAGPVALTDTATVGRATTFGLCVAEYSSGLVGVFVLNIAVGVMTVHAGVLAVAGSGMSLSSAMAQKDSVSASTFSTAICPLVAASTDGRLTVFAHGLPINGVAVTGATSPIRTFTIDQTNSITSGPETFATSYAVDLGMCGPFIASAPIVSAERIYLPVFVAGADAAGTNLQNTWFLLDDEGTVVAKALAGAFGVPIGAALGTPPSVMFSDGKFACLAPERGTLLVDGVQNFTPIGIARLDLDFAHVPTSAQVGPAVFFSGGVLTQYDGAQCTEAGFHFYPEEINTSLAAGSLTGTYQYCALYEWMDGAGQRHQSAPSVPLTVTPSSQNVTLNIPVLFMTEKTGIQIAVFRTLDEGTTFFRVNGPHTQIGNTPTSGQAVVSYTDSASDATIEDNEVLYTTGGVLENVGPGPCLAVTEHQDRLWMVGLEEPSEFRFSQAASPTVGLAVGLEFNEALSGRVSQDIGALTAVGVMDDKLVLYSATDKAALVGNGPTPTGLQSTYSDPQSLPGDIGCPFPRSIINVPTGQMYQSQRGIYLLNRALQDEYIGSPVEGLVIGSEVVEAIAMPDRAQVRFPVIHPEGAIGTCVGFPGLALGQSSSVLAYDSQFQQWSSHSSDTDPLITGACVWDGRATYANANLPVIPRAGAIGVAVGAPGLGLGQSEADPNAMLQAMPGSYLDLGETVIPVALETQWIRLGNLSGFERVRRMVLNGSFGSDSAVTVGVSLNYKNDIVYTATVDSTGDIAEDDIVQIRHHIERQKCQAIKFTITDTPTGLPTSGAGCNFSGITLELGMKRGTAKLPAESSAAST
jgi:hypothetical protein